MVNINKFALSLNMAGSGHCLIRWRTDGNRCFSFFVEIFDRCLFPEMTLTVCVYVCTRASVFFFLFFFYSCEWQTQRTNVLLVFQNERRREGKESLGCRCRSNREGGNAKEGESVRIAIHILMIWTSGFVFVDWSWSISCW